MTEPHTYYPKYAKNIKCKECAGKLEICAFLDGNGKYLSPILSCYRCGSIYDLDEYKLTEKDISVSKEEYEKIVKQEKEEDGQRQVLSG